MSLFHDLVLAGGSSRRMGQDTAALAYDGRPQLDRVSALLAPRVSRCVVSLREDQETDGLRSADPRITDRPEAIGPGAGVLAHEDHPDVAWPVLACDLPPPDAVTIEALIQARRNGCTAIALRSEHHGLPERPFTIWKPEALEMLSRQVAAEANRLTRRQEQTCHE